MKINSIVWEKQLWEHYEAIAICGSCQRFLAHWWRKLRNITSCSRQKRHHPGVYYLQERSLMMRNKGPKVPPNEQERKRYHSGRMSWKETGLRSWVAESRRYELQSQKSYSASNLFFSSLCVLCKPPMPDDDHALHYFELFGIVIKLTLCFCILLFYVILHCSKLFGFQ